MKLTHILLENQDKIDFITLDIPLFLRLLEYAREDVEEDENLHVLTQNAVRLSKMKNLLTMEDYNEITSREKTLQEDAIEDTYKRNRELAKKALTKYIPAGKGLLTQYLSIKDPIQANKFWVDRKISTLIQSVL